MTSAVDPRTASVTSVAFRSSRSDACARGTSTIVAVSARTIAAALTPLRDGGDALDEAAFAPYLDFLATRGIDGVLALGSTGEGILLSRLERQTALARFAAGPLPVLAHCGAQTTADTVALSAYAAELGVEAVAVIAPPYYQFDDDALLAHFAAAARACAPLPFYVYELEKASGYAIPVAVVERLRETVDNVVGMKVSDAPFSKVEPYLLDGLDVLIGAEALIGEGLAAGAAGAVSGLASAFPEVVVEAVRSGDSTAAGRLRATVERFPRLAALKAVAVARGVPMREDMRAPNRGLTDPERARAARGRSLGELVDRAARALVDVGASRVDVVGRLRPRAPRPARPAAASRPAVAPRAAPASPLGSAVVRDSASFARSSSAGGAVVRRRWRSQRAHAEGSGSEGEQALHRPVTRAMLHSRRFSPRPSRRPRNGVQEAGPIQSMRRRNSGR